MNVKVQCGPGGHEIFIEQAYWCSRCGYYTCYQHALTSFLVDTIQCPNRHELIRFGPAAIEPVRAAWRSR